VQQEERGRPPGSDLLFTLFQLPLQAGHVLNQIRLGGHRDALCNIPKMRREWQTLVPTTVMPFSSLFPISSTPL
jgi:hypothetical protein